MLSIQSALLLSLLVFAALIFWVLFGKRSKMGGDNAAITIVVAVALALAVIGILLHAI